MFSFFMLVSKRKNRLGTVSRRRKNKKMALIIARGIFIDDVQYSAVHELSLTKHVNALESVTIIDVWNPMVII